MAAEPKASAATSAAPAADGPVAMLPRKTGVVEGETPGATKAPELDAKAATPSAPAMTPALEDMEDMLPAEGLRLAGLMSSMSLKP